MAAQSGIRMVEMFTQFCSPGQARSVKKTVMPRNQLNMGFGCDDVIKLSIYC